MAGLDLLHEDILQVRAPFLNFYVLRDGKGLILIDGGFIGGEILLRKALRRQGWDDLPIQGILVTHGHLDHILNVSSLAASSGAWIRAPKADAQHYIGQYPYRGQARVCGILEATGRVLLNYQPFPVERWLEDGMEIPVWQGLKVVHLPGHTDGHIGLYCSKLRLLFSGDLFACYGRFGYLPPDIFNSHPDQIPASVDKALSLELDGVLPCHCDKKGPESHLDRLRALRQRLQRTTPAE